MADKNPGNDKRSAQIAGCMTVSALVLGPFVMLVLSWFGVSFEEFEQFIRSVWGLPE